MKSTPSQSNLQAVFNILLTAVGVGILSVPKAIDRSGYVFGFLALIIFALIAFYMCILLKRCMQLATKLEISVCNYEDIGFAAFRTIGRIMVSIPLHISLVGCSCSIIVLLGKYTELLVSTSSSLQPAWYMVIWTVLMTPMVLLKDLGHLGYVTSSLGSVSVAVLSITIVVCGMVNMYSSRRIVYDHKPDGLGGIGFGFATFTFAYAVTCTIPTILRDMKFKEDAPRVLFIGITVVFVVYGVIGIAGYAGWGRQSRTADTIIDLISIMGSKQRAYCIVSLLLACVCHFAVMIHPTCRMLEDIFKCSDRWFWRTIIRLSLVGCTLLVACLVQEFSKYIEVLGSVTFALIHSVYPPIFYIRLMHMTGYSLRVVNYIVLILIISLSLVGGYCGLSGAIKGLTQ